MSIPDSIPEQPLTLPPNATQAHSKKRKRTEKSTTKPPTTTPTPAPKPKKAKTKKASSNTDENLDLENSLNLSISHMDPQLLSDYLTSRTRKFESELSDIELGDRYIPIGAIRDTCGFEKIRGDGELPGFLEWCVGNGGIRKLWGSSKSVGCPHTILVCGGGLRAAEVVRVLRPYSTKESTIAKLFAKHIKIADQINFLKKTKTGIAVGTPQRLEDLMDNGALNTEKLERIVIDASHIDVKKRGILDMRETLGPLVKWLARKEFRERYDGDGDGGKTKLEILFY